MIFIILNLPVAKKQRHDPSCKHPIPTMPCLCKKRRNPTACLFLALADLQSIRGTQVVAGDKDRHDTCAIAAKEGPLKARHRHADADTRHYRSNFTRSPVKYGRLQCYSNAKVKIHVRTSQCGSYQCIIVHLRSGHCAYSLSHPWQSLVSIWRSRLGPHRRRSRSCSTVAVPLWYSRFELHFTIFHYWKETEERMGVKFLMHEYPQQFAYC